MLRSTLVAVFVLVATFRAAVYAQRMNPDGVSYIDIATAYVDGRLGDVLNAYWSPLYSWLIAGVFALLRPAPEWEYPVVQLVNVGVAAVAAFALDFFLLQLVRLLPAGWEPTRRKRVARQLWVVGFVMLLWTATYAIDVSLITPDWCVATLFLLVMAFVVTWGEEPPTIARRCTVGVLLAAGYLAKAAMLPIGVVVLAGVMLVEWRRGRGRALLVTPMMFVLCVAPWVALLSAHKDRFTTGDSARLAYAWLVSGPAPQQHWQGDDSTGTAAHPTRRLPAPIPAFEFARPVAGTYPVWYDATYWNEGLRPRVNLPAQRAVIAKHLRMYADFILRHLSGVVIAAALLAVAAARNRARDVPRTLVEAAALVLVPSLAAAAMYGLVYTEWRYLGGFLLAATLATLLVLQVAAGESRFVTAAFVLSTVLFGVRCVRGIRHDLGVLREGWDAPSWPLHTARLLKRDGLVEGTDVAVIGHGPKFAEWARLARVRIVAELPEPHRMRFLLADSVSKARVIGALAATGSRMVVAEFPDTYRPGRPWRRVPDTPLYYQRLERGDTAGSR